MILVTGGTGLVGSHLLFDLVSKGLKVKALKRNSSSFELPRKIFSYYYNNPDTLFSQIEWVDGDVTDIYSMYDAMENIDHVYHTAAMVSFDASDRKKMMAVNIEGTANIVNAALKNKIKKLCYVSSIATLGRADNNDLIEEETHWKNSKKNSSYSLSKYGAEREVWRGIAEGLPSVIVNPSVIIGPGNWEKGSSKLFKQVWDGLRFYTSGVNGYVDVRDVAKTMIALMESDISDSRFIVSSENIDYLKLFSLIAEGLGKNKPSVKANLLLSKIAWRVEKMRSYVSGNKPLITKETARTAFQKYYYSNEKIKKTLGFEFIPIEVSIKETCNYFLKEK